MKSLRIQVDQDRVRQLGVSSKSPAEALNAVASGIVVTEVPRSIKIDMDMARKLDPWDAVIDATTNRLRPIVLTAAASLGMIPIASEVFWGPMAYAIIGGSLSRGC
jgi:multidrug efflux pump subunit AcrB